MSFVRESIVRVRGVQPPQPTNDSFRQLRSVIARTQRNLVSVVVHVYTIRFLGTGTDAKPDRPVTARASVVRVEIDVHTFSPRTFPETRTGREPFTSFDFITAPTLFSVFFRPRHSADRKTRTARAIFEQPEDALDFRTNLFKHVQVCENAVAVAFVIADVRNFRFSLRISVCVVPSSNDRRFQ